MRTGTAIATLLLAAACRHVEPAKPAADARPAAEQKARELACTATCLKSFAQQADADEAWGGECKALCKFANTPTCIHDWCELECAVANAKGIGAAIGHWCSTGGDGWRICRQSCAKVPMCQTQWCADTSPARARALAVITATREACVAQCALVK